MRLKSIHRRDTIFISFILLVFACLFYLHLGNIYLKDGSSAIYRAKLEALNSDKLSFEKEKTKILFLGNSKILAGIIPSRFDSTMANKTTSLNLAMGGKSASDGIEMLTSLDIDLDVLVLNDNFPFYTNGKPEKQNFLKFNNYIKDLYYFVVRAKQKDLSLSSWYKKTKDQCNLMIEQKGYYYIESQALFPDQKLPKDFRHSADDSELLYEFSNKEMIDTDPFIKYIRDKKIKVFIVPNYFRVGQFKYSSNSRISKDERTRFESENIYYLDAIPYYLYPNQNFADRTHLNLYGAQQYTNDISALLQNEIQQSK